MSKNPRVPEPTVTFHHHTPVQLRFSDFDMFGHLNNTIYFNLMDTAKVSYFNKIAPSHIDWSNAGIVIVHIGADFYAPTFPGDQIEILTAVTRIGEKSLEVEQRIIEINTGETKCIGHTIMAGFDVATSSSMPIPEHWAEAICHYEGRRM